MFHSIPHPGEFGYDTWPKDAYKTAGGVHNWSELTVDEANGIAFIPFGTARYDFFGGNAPGNNLFANSLVALDARTRQAALASAARASRPLGLRPAAGAEAADDPAERPRASTSSRRPRSTASCSCSTAKSGEPIWPIEERAVPQSDCRASTRRPRSRSRRSRRRSPCSRSPSATSIRSCRRTSRTRCVERLRTSRNEGLFTPPSLQGSISMPGHNGGANWASSAVDPVNGEFYVVSKNLPVMLRASYRTRSLLRARDRHGGHARNKRRPHRVKAKEAAAKGPGALPGAVRLHAQPEERHGRDRPAVVAHHRVRPEHGRDQVARAGRQHPGPGIPRRLRRAFRLAARRS